MANCCLVDISCTFKEGHLEAARKLYHKLSSNKRRASKRGADTGFYFGSRSTWMFDGDVQRDGLKVTMTGWVKWSLSDAVFIDFVLYAGLYDAAEVTCFQDERGNAVYGNLRWEGGDVIHSRFVRIEDWPRPPEDVDNDDEAVDEALSKALESSDEVELKFDEVLKEQDRFDKLLSNCRRRLNSEQFRSFRC